MGDKDNNRSKISRSGGMENLSLESNRYSQDFLTRFMESGWREGKEEGYDDDDDDDDDDDEDEEDEKIELNLGLSLGGRFGVDKCSTKLLRASSIAECLPFVKNKDDSLTVSPSPVATYSKLVRTISLPLESEEWRKRKELQTLRRMEAKRRRSEKQRNLKGDKEEAQPIQIDSRVALPPTSAIKGRHGGGIHTKGKGMHEFGQLLLSQGSVESQGGGGGSSSSELDNRSSLRGSRSCGDASHSLQESNNQETGSSGTKSVFRTSSLDAQNPQKPSDMARNQARVSALEDMPCVFTKGDGPNGRRVDGILYKFGKGEDVRIMCVCHGSFHSPAGFVKHAGGTDVTHPLKHIVMNPNSAPST